MTRRAFLVTYPAFVTGTMATKANSESENMIIIAFVIGYSHFHLPQYAHDLLWGIPLFAIF
jgi:hypothetical protein